MKQKFILITVTLLLAITGCSQKQEVSDLPSQTTLSPNQTEKKSELPVFVENELLDGDIYNFGWIWEKEALGLLTNKGMQYIKVPISEVIVLRSLVYDHGQIYGCYDNKQDKSILFHFDSLTQNYRIIKNDFAAGFQFEYINKTIMGICGKNEIWSLNIENGQEKKTHFQLENTHTLQSVFFYKNGFIIDCSVESQGKAKNNEAYITDSNGKIIKKINRQASIYFINRASISPDSSKMVYSIGQTGDHVELYDFNRDQSVKMPKSMSVGQWSEDGNWYYYVEYKGTKDDRYKYALKRIASKDLVPK